MSHAATVHRKPQGASCRLQRKGIEAQERSGKLAAWAPPPPPPRQTLEERVGLPPYLAPTLQDPAAARALALSRELWSNTLPGALCSARLLSYPPGPGVCGK